MSDIVDSLRRSAEWIEEMEHESWLDTAELQRDAANEIERLRAEVRKVRLNHITTLGELQVADETITRLNDDNDALRAAETALDDDLVAELRDWSFIVDESQGHAHVVMLSGQVFAKAADELERLRAAGDTLAGYSGQPCECLRDPNGRLDDVCNPCKHRFAWEEARRG